MTTLAAVELITVGAEVVKAILGLISEAVKAVEPPSAEELLARIEGALRDHRDDWLERAKADADAAFAAAVAGEEKDV